MVSSRHHLDLIQFSILIPPHAKSLWSEGGMYIALDN